MPRPPVPGRGTRSAGTIVGFAVSLGVTRFRILVGATVVLSIACAPSPPSPSPSANPPPPTAPSASASGPTIPAGIFARISPSVVYVATEIGAGTGFVLDATHVVTNAHVLRPFAQARLVLADGSKVDRATVAGWDLLADLVLLEVAGPLSAPALTRTASARESIGDRVYLVGYPQADPANPRATITEGIIAGPTVEWFDGLTYLETDATIDAGQSGGVVVDDEGRFVGVTGGSRGTFAVALAASDAFDRVMRLAGGEDVDRLPDGVLPAPRTDAPRDVAATVRNRADERVWLLTGAQGDAEATVRLTADGPLGLFALAAGGLLGHGAGPPTRTQTLKVQFDAPGPYLVKIQSLGHAAIKARLRSTVGLTAVVDAEDGDPVAIGVPRLGRADYAGDIDWFVADLDAGRRVTVRVAASGFDPALFLDATGKTDETLATGHNAGGPLGMDDEIAFTPKKTGRYRIVVTDGRFMGSGGYRLVVTAP